MAPTRQESVGDHDVGVDIVNLVLTLRCFVLSGFSKWVFQVWPVTKPRVDIER